MKVNGNKVEFDSFPLDTKNYFTISDHRLGYIFQFIRHKSSNVHCYTKLQKWYTQLDVLHGNK